MSYEHLRGLSGNALRVNSIPPIGIPMGGIPMGGIPMNSVPMTALAMNTGPLTDSMARPYLSLVADSADVCHEFESVDDDADLWQERALCAQTDPEAFFPEKGGSTREAKKICMGCEVRTECLEYALANDERFGIWGGLSERERRRLKRGIG